jgi:hypothetical protein
MQESVRTRIERIRARILDQRSRIAQASHKRSLASELASVRLDNIEKIFLAEAILRKDWSLAQWDVRLKAAEDEVRRAEDLQQSTETSVDGRSSG